jgi:hypothetical protein
MPQVGLQCHPTRHKYSFRNEGMIHFETRNICLHALLLTSARFKTRFSSTKKRSLFLHTPGPDIHPIRPLMNSRVPRARSGFRPIDGNIAICPTARISSAASSTLDQSFDSNGWCDGVVLDRGQTNRIDADSYKIRITLCKPRGARRFTASAICKTFSVFRSRR